MNFVKMKYEGFSVQHILKFKLMSISSIPKVRNENVFHAYKDNASECYASVSGNDKIPKVYQGVCLCP